MKTINEVTEMITGQGVSTYKASRYTMIDDVLVRVSNHLPNCANFGAENEDVERIFLIFTECELSEREIENYIEEEMGRYIVDYILYDDSYSNEFILHSIRSLNNITL